MVDSLPIPTVGGNGEMNGNSAQSSARISLAGNSLESDSLTGNSLGGDSLAGSSSTGIIPSISTGIEINHPWKKNVLLIIHDVYQDFNVFPLAYGYLAAMLQTAGYSVEVYCMDVFHYTNAQLEKKLLNSEYDLIGAGFMPARFEETIVGLCESVNKYKKNAWFFLGGPGPTPIPEYMLQRTRADLVLMGEAEHSIVEVMDAKLGKRRLSEIKGITYWESDQVKVNPRRPVFRDLDSLPWPAWDLFPMESYTQSWRMAGMDSDEKTCAIIANRGCTDTCSFCYRIEKGLRLRNLNEIIKEMKYLTAKYGITYFHFLEELSTFPRNRVFEFERLLKENNLNVKWCCNSRAPLFDEEVALSLKKAGCLFVNIGFESVDQTVLDEMNKRVTAEDNLKALQVANKVEIGMGLNFIWGFEKDTKETLWKNVKAIKTYTRFDQVRTIRPPTPYPGSPLYYQAIEKGIISGPDDFFKKFRNSDLITFNFTRFSDQECNEMLFEANKELVFHHFRNAGGDLEEANQIIEGYRRLYLEGDYKFRGARRYDKESRQKSNLGGKKEVSGNGQDNGAVQVIVQGGKISVDQAIQVEKAIVDQTAQMITA